MFYKVESNHWIGAKCLDIEMRRRKKKLGHSDWSATAAGAICSFQGNFGHQIFFVSLTVRPINVSFGLIRDSKLVVAQNVPVIKYLKYLKRP